MALPDGCIGSRAEESEGIAMKYATLLLSLCALTTSYACGQAAADYGGAVGAAAKTTAGAAGALGRAEQNATGATGAATASKSGGATVTTIHSNGRSTLSPPGRRVTAALAEKIDSKTAKAGDGLTARTTSRVLLAGGVLLPAGTRLIGQVTESQAGSAGQSGGRLAFMFERAVLRDGRQLPIHAMLESISGPGSSAAGRDAGTADTAPPVVIAAPIRVMSAEGTTVYGETGAVAHSNGPTFTARSNLRGLMASSSGSGSMIMDTDGSDVVLASGTQLVLMVSRN
jgi:hypothetical protein